MNDFTQGGVTYMMKKIPGYIGVCLLLLAILAGCSETQPSEQPIVKETETANTITVAVDGSTFLPDATKSIKRDFSEGLTLKKALLNSGLVDFTADGKRIQSVGEVSLDSSLSWAVKLNGKDIEQEDWDMELHAKDEVIIYVKAADSGGMALRIRQRYSRLAVETLCQPLIVNMPASTFKSAQFVMC